MAETWRNRLKQVCPQVEIREEEPMAGHVSFRIGGPAAAMAFPKSEEQLGQLLRFCSSEGIRPLVLGAGTNLLPPDDGVNNLVICLLGGLNTLEDLGGGRIAAGAGVPMAKAASFAASLGLSGLEFAHGIPGTVGGGVFMNAGAYGGEICQVAVETAVMGADGEVRLFRGDAQGFGYRASAFQAMDGVILWTVFALTPDDRDAISARMHDLAQRRRASQPLNVPSAGSTFKRPAGGYAAALIDSAGLKGLRVGGAVVSQKHAGFVVNDGNATCADVLALIAEIQQRVFAQSGIRLEPEVQIL